MVKLGDYVKNSSRKNKNGGCTAVYSVTNSQGFIPSTEYFSKEVYSKELGTYKLVDRGMIAYNPSRINVGSVALQDCVDQAIVSPLYVVFSVDDTRLSPEYVVRFLKSKPGLDQIAFRSIGTVRNNLKFDGLCQMDIAVPALEVQEQCVIALKGIESQKTLAEKYLSKLDELVKSRFVEMFGGSSNEMLLRWPTKKLDDCVESIDSGKSPNCRSESRQGNKPAVLKLSALSSGIFLAGENKVLPEGEEIPSDKEIRKGDILVARKNTPELVGACVLVKEDISNLMFPDLVFRMHPFGNVEGSYLSALLSVSPFAAEVKLLAHGSAKSMSNIPKSELKKLMLPIPPLELQQEFAFFVQQVDKLKFIAQQQMEKLQELYDSLAQEYFGV